ncbi:4'-phosphopantetheinyl transferase superfamily protein [Chitinivorax sp. B]|uniref:4'-phosphopantetheinyl transferase family protein n=1 Tax=Chitinivorax sp. B TaxID=2502235 RepID=UPI0010F95EF2|nr:4'-phosphopantetheinyl transferase superfamily protein [Chitinivorax sp. B]
MMPFCQPPQPYWPWRESFPNLSVYATEFQLSAFQPVLLDTLGTSIPTSIQRSAPKRQADYLSGRLCASQALQSIGIEGWIAPIGEDRAPQWPAGLVGSITHGTGMAAAAVARAEHYRGVGIDVETLLKPETLHNIAESVLTPAEQTILADMLGAQQAAFIATVFSLKESLYKALYPIVGKSFYFHDAEVVGWDANQTAVTLKLLLDLSNDWRVGHTVTGYYAAQHARVISLVLISA